MSTTPPTSESRLGADGPVRVTARSTTGRADSDHGMSFLRTSEFLVLSVLSVVLVLASALADEFDAGRAWTLVAVLGAAYILSRGLAKLGRGRDDDVS